MSEAAKRAYEILKRLHNHDVVFGTIIDETYDTPAKFVPERVVSAGLDPLYSSADAEKPGWHETARKARIYVSPDEEVSIDTGVMISEVYYNVKSISRGETATVLDLECDEWI